MIQHVTVYILDGYRGSFEPDPNEINFCSTFPVDSRLTGINLEKYITEFILKNDKYRYVSIVNLQKIKEISIEIPKSCYF